MRSMFRMGFSAEPWFAMGQTEGLDALARKVEGLQKECDKAYGMAETYRYFADRDPAYESEARQAAEARDAVCAEYQDLLAAYVQYQQAVGLGQIERGQLVGPTTVNLPRSDIENGNGSLLRALPVPKGWTATYPYVVKVGNVGEYIVYADKTAQYIEYGTGRVFAPQRIQ